MGADSRLEAVYGTGPGNIAGDAVPHSHRRREEGVLEAVDAGGWLDVFVGGAHSWLEVRLRRDGNEAIDYPVHHCCLSLCSTPLQSSPSEGL